jgi:lipid-A-disaccharide synthase
MVNLVAGRKVVPEVMQNDVTGGNLAREARHLLKDPAARQHMKAGLAEVAASLSGADDPMDGAAGVVQELLEEGLRDVR